MKMNVSKVTLVELFELAENFDFGFDGVSRDVNGTFAML